MRFYSAILSLVVILSLPFGQGECMGQTTERMFLVLLEVEDPKDIPFCYTRRCDKKKVPIDYDFEDTINYLEDFIYEEEQLFGPECFVPEMKMIFKHYTYVISLHCTSAIKYKNASPYEPSSVRMKNDLVFTSSVYMYLADMKDKHFGEIEPNWELINNAITSEPLISPEDESGDLDFLMDDELDDDLFLDEELDLHTDPDLDLFEEDLDEFEDDLDLFDEFEEFDDDDGGL